MLDCSSSFDLNIHIFWITHSRVSFALMVGKVLRAIRSGGIPILGCAAILCLIWNIILLLGTFSVFSYIFIKLITVVE